MLKPVKRAQRDALEAALVGYERALPMVEGYLSGRGITPDVARCYRLGYVAEPVVGHEHYVGRLAIPYLTPAGVVDLRFRAVAGDGAKYLSRPGAQPTLYNVAGLHRATDRVVVCEGEMDTIVMDGVVGLPAVGCPGVQLWQAYYARLFADFTRVYVLGDGDDAATAYGCDLSYDYVKINGDYRS